MERIDAGLRFCRHSLQLAAAIGLVSNLRRNGIHAISERRHTLQQGGATDRVDLHIAGAFLDPARQLAFALVHPALPGAQLLANLGELFSHCGIFGGRLDGVLILLFNIYRTLFKLFIRLRFTCRNRIFNALALFLYEHIPVRCTDK